MISDTTTIHSNHQNNSLITLTKHVCKLLNLRFFPHVLTLGRRNLTKIRAVSIIALALNQEVMWTSLQAFQQRYASSRLGYTACQQSQHVRARTTSRGQRRAARAAASLAVTALTQTQQRAVAKSKHFTREGTYCQNNFLQQHIDIGRQICRGTGLRNYVSKREKQIGSISPFLRVFIFRNLRNTGLIDCDKV